MPNPWSALTVYTAPASYTGPGRVPSLHRDQSAPDEAARAGAAFAPSWDLLGLLARAANKGATDRQWFTLRKRYAGELKGQRHAHRTCWRWLREQAEVTIVCACAVPENCHRVWLAQLLYTAGARYAGERPAKEG